MNKSILTRLITGSLLLVVMIALLGACFFVGLRVDRAAAADARRLSGVMERVQQITLHASYLLHDGSMD